MCIAGGGTNGNHRIAQDRDVTATPAQSAFWQLDIAYDRVGIAVGAADQFNGISLFPNVVLKLFDGHRSGRRRRALVRGREAVAVFDRNFSI